VKEYFSYPASDRILVAQLRLLCRNLVSTVMPAIILSASLAAALSSAANWPELVLWCACVIATKVGTGFYARRLLSANMTTQKPAQEPTQQARRQLTWLMWLNAAYGASWGALAWVSLDRADLPSNILMLAVLAGVLGHTVAVLSPVILIFIAFTLALTFAMLSHLWWINDLTYTALLAPSVLYLISLLWQARNSAAEVRASIALAFDNEVLVERANAARLEAEQANLVKAKFLATASHDLRQPIHAQGLFLEILGGTELSVYQNKILTSARSASLASSEMLNSLLEFSRIEAGVLKPHIKPFDLQIMLNKIENDLAPQADAKNMLYRSRETTALVNSDPSLIEIILRNLVSNAIFHTDSGGVLIGCRRRGNKVVVEVWDTGVGIDPSQQQNIFREFHQLGNSERDRRKGLGLGLAVAQGLATVLGHELSLSSRPGKGSVFRLILPLNKKVLAQGEPVRIYPAQSLNAVHVLAIDDDEAVRQGMADLLGSWGCTVDTADSITQALELAQQHPPAIVISDYRLRAQRTGAQAVAVLRALLGQNLPALLISGDTAPERLREAVASGVPLLHKPVNPEHLFQLIAQAINQRGADIEQDKTWQPANLLIDCEEVLERLKDRSVH
jgi:signal transduction histidine kinase/FixJ family two-component response regulator